MCSKDLPEGCGFKSNSSMNDSGGQATMNLLYKELGGLLCEDIVMYAVGAHIGVYSLGRGLEHRWSLSNLTLGVRRSPDVAAAVVEMEVLTEEPNLARLEFIDRNLIAMAEVVGSPQRAVLDMVKGSHR